MRETRPVSDFNAIVTQGYGNIILKQGDVCSLEIEADDEIMPHIKSEVVNGRLELSFKNWWRVFFSFFPPIRYHITVKELTSVLVSGSGNLECEQLVGDALELEMTGSSKMNIADLKVSSLVVSVSGSGELNLAGSVGRCDMKISGSGRFNTQELTTQEARVRISGSGDITLRVEKKLDVHISGSGSVKYIGQPEVTQIISGSGRIQAL